MRKEESWKEKETCREGKKEKAGGGYMRVRVKGDSVAACV